MRQRRRPTTRNAARALGADPDQLRHFVEYHPDPDTAALLAATDTDADALDRAERELVAAWIQQQKHTQRRTAKDELYEIVKDGGPVRQERILREAENASPSLLLSLASDGVLARETPGDPLQTPPDEWIYRAVRPPEDYHPVD